jgi:type IV pilus assembly protein PilW
MKALKGTQSGFSLISLLIASAIGLFLIGGAGKVYVDSKNTFLARSAIAAATENYRFAFQDMRRALVLAGRDVLQASDEDRATGTFPPLGADGILDEDDNDSSIIAVRYASGPAPCGLSGDVSGLITVRFYIDDSGNLVCEVPEENYAQPLVSGIARMRAFYGVDTDGDGIANQYLTATVIEDSSRWINVVSIRIGMVAGSGADQELPTAYRPESAEPLDLLGTEFTPDENSRAYKSANTTIAFRNLRQGMYRQ